MTEDIFFPQYNLWSTSGVDAWVREIMIAILMFKFYWIWAYYTRTKHSGYHSRSWPKWCYAFSILWSLTALAYPACLFTWKGIHVRIQDLALFQRVRVPISMLRSKTWSSLKELGYHLHGVSYTPVNYQYFKYHRKRPLRYNHLGGFFLFLPSFLFSVGGSGGRRREMENLIRWESVNLCIIRKCLYVSTYHTTFRKKKVKMVP